MTKALQTFALGDSRPQCHGPPGLKPTIYTQLAGMPCLPPKPEARSLPLSPAGDRANGLIFAPLACKDRLLGERILQFILFGSL